MSKNWDEIFKQQSEQTANIDFCWIDGTKQTRPDKPRKLVMCGGGGNGFAMPYTVIRK